MVVGVPCNAVEYITANYGANWSEPTPDWDWRVSPPNARLNGFWTAAERPLAIELNLKYYNEDLIDVTTIPAETAMIVTDPTASNSTFLPTTPMEPVNSTAVA